MPFPCYGLDPISVTDPSKYRWVVHSQSPLMYSVLYLKGTYWVPFFSSATLQHLEDIIQDTSTSLLGYADDHAVYSSFLPMDEHLALKNLSVVADKIRNWMRQSFLKMNHSKTEIVIFGTRGQCSKITATSIEVGDTSVNISPKLTYLGVLLNQNLMLKSHILKKAKRASYHPYRIRQIIKFLDLPAKQTLISSHVMSHLDYSNAIFVNLPNSSIYPMQ